MRKGVLIAVSATISGLLIVALVGAVMAATNPVTSSAISSAPSAAATPQSVAGTATQEHQLPATQADELVRQRQAAYRAQLAELSQRLEVGQARVAALTSQEQALRSQLHQLEQARQERAASYRSQVRALQEQYGQRFAQYAAQWQEIQSRLAQANSLLDQ